LSDMTNVVIMRRVESRLAKRFINLLIILALLLPVSSTARQISQKTDRQNAIPPASLSRSIERAEDLRKRWRLEEAEVAYRDVLNHDRMNEQALIGLASIEQTHFNYTAARALLERAYIPGHSDADVLVAFGDLYLSVEEPERAASYFNQAIRVSPGSNAAIIGIARVSFLHRDFSGAKKTIENLLNANSENISAREVLARIYVEEDQHPKAAVEASRVLKTEPYNVGALFTLCLAQVAERKPDKADEVRSLAREVLDLNPYNISARRILSQYVNSKKAYASSIKPPARARYERGQQLRDAGKLRESVAEFKTALEIEPEYYQALLALGAVYLSLNDYEDATSIAKRAIAIDSEGSLAQLQLSQAYSLQQETERLSIGATNFRSRFMGMRVGKYSGIADIFTNYDSLTPEQQQVIDFSVAPLAQYLPALRQLGGRHFLLPLDMRLSEVRTELEDRITFDGRYYSSVRGVGGLTTASGVEYLDAAMRGDFNTIAHEFAHQIHTSVFDDRMKRRILSLYTRAKTRERTLDYYAASNEFEYFAQGYEAYISPFKRPSAAVTARHTRDELRRKDPELYQLIDELAKESPIKIW